MAGTPLPLNPNSTIAQVNSTIIPLVGFGYDASLPHIACLGGYLVVPAGYKILAAGSPVAQSAYFTGKGGLWVKSAGPGAIVPPSHIYIAPLPWQEIAMRRWPVSFSPPTDNLDINSYEAAMSAQRVDLSAHGYQGFMLPILFAPAGYRVKSIGEKHAKGDYFLHALNGLWCEVDSKKLGYQVIENFSPVISPVALAQVSAAKWSCGHRRLSEAPTACGLCKVWFHRHVTT